jgi:type II secretory pathway pseudopilin PulG
MKILKNTKGITMIEIALVIIIFGISVGLSILYHQSSQIRADLRSQVSQFTSYVRLAHSNALSGLNDDSHGVHLETSSYTTFIGDTYDPLDDFNFVMDLPGALEIQNINLNGGGNDIIFTTSAGETNNYGSVDFVSDQIKQTTTIEITKYGTVTY